MKNLIDCCFKKRLHPAANASQLNAVSVFIVVILIFSMQNAFAQPTVLGTQVVNGGYVTYDLNVVGGFKQVRLQATSAAGSGTRNWEFARGTSGATDYSIVWRPYAAGQIISAYNSFIDPATNPASARYNSGSGGSSGLLPAVTAGNYYTFNISNNGLSDNNMAVLETIYNPVNFVSASQYPLSPTSSSGVTLTVTMAAAPNAAENVFVRYSTDNFVSSFIVPVAFTGATGKATIPAIGAGTVKYYFLSTPAAAGIPTHTNADMYTLNLLNNAGANYSYTIAGAFVQYERNSFSEVYTAITVGGGATQVNSGAATTDFNSTGFPAGTTDDGAAMIPLPFAFNFGGSAYTATTNFVNICTNGFISFSASNGIANKQTDASSELLFNTGTIDGAIAGWWDDLNINVGSVLYQTRGTAPNRNFTVQFTGVRTYAATATSTINFQIIIYETSDAIELRYGTAANAVHNSAESATLGVEWGTGGVGKFVDAVSGSKTLGCSMNNAEQFPKLNYRFFPVAAAPVALISGTYNAGTGQVYPSLSEAIADLNHRGVSGAVTINCTDATYDAAGGNIFPLNLSVIPGSSAANAVTIQGNAASIKTPGVYQGNIITVNAAITMGSGADLGIVQLVGTDYLTFRNFSIGYSGSFPAGIVKPARGIQVFNATSTDGATNNIVRDLTIVLDRAVALSQGIYQRQSTGVVIASAGGANSGNRYYNLNISNVYSGIFLSGNASFLDLGTEIGTISGGLSVIGGAAPGDIGNGSAPAYGIKTEYQNNIRIFNCEIRNITTTVSGSNGVVDGIYGFFLTGTTDIYNNKIHGLRNSSIAYSSNNVTGIRFTYNNSGSHLIRIYNNVIYGLSSGYTGVPVQQRQLRGIYSQGSGGTTAQAINIYHNSVLLDGSASPNISSDCFEMVSTSGSFMNCLNNIFANITGPQTAPAAHYAVGSASNSIVGPSGSTWNRNIYYVTNQGAGTGNGFTGHGSSNNFTTLADWQTAMATQDVNSFGSNPQFISATDLHINTAAVSDAESGASVIAGINIDVDGETRDAVSPDIGADEFEGCSALYFKWTGTTSSEWNTASNWCSNAVPTATSWVVISSGTPNSPVISTANAFAASVMIGSGASLTMSIGNNLSISATGKIVNNGTFSASGTGAVIFLGTGTVEGSSAITFNNLVINGNLTANTIPTIYGSFQINAGTISAAPGYGSSSTLIYNTGIATTVSNEWTANISSGNGVPQNVRIGNGANTSFSFGSSGSFWQALGSILISNGSTLTLSSGVGSDFRVGGSWTNNGTFNAGIRLVTFNGTANAVIDGTSSSAFGEIQVNKGISIATTLDVNVTTTITASALTNILNGLLRINGTGSLSKSSASGLTISSTGGLDVNGGSFTLLASISNAGLIRVSGGTASVGVGGPSSINYSSGSSIIISGGVLNVGARISPASAGFSTVTYNQSGGTVTVMKNSSASASLAAFDISVPGSSFTWSNGTIIIERQQVTMTSDYYINASTYSVTGGTLQLGDNLTPALQVFRIRSNAPLFNLTIDNSSANNPTAQLVFADLAVNGTNTLSNGTILDIGGRTLTLNGPVLNAGGTYTGSAASNLNITGSGAITGNFNFTVAARNLGVLVVDRNGVPATIGTNLTVNANGGYIASGSTLNNLAGTTFAISSGGITGFTLYGLLTVAGTLQLNAGGYINGGGMGMRGPRYALNSYLIYNNSGGFIRNVEWGSNTFGTDGYPHHVIIQNGTSVDFTATATFDVGCGGDLTIGTATAGTLNLSNFDAPHSLYVSGNINIGGTAAGIFTMSDDIGSDLYLNGNWTRNANGTVNFGSGNGRAVFFTGNTDAVVTADNGQTFPYAYVNKGAVATKLTLADNVNISDEIGFSRGTVDLGTNNKFISILSTATKTARVGQSDSANTAFVYGATDKLGQFIIQRHIPARRSWRLMAAPLKPGGGSHTISEAWQERGAPLTGLDYTAANYVASIASDSISAGYGTQITGGTIANGFDLSPNNNPSIKVYNSGLWTGPANINATSVNSVEGWMLFLRGDRKNYGEITNQFKTPVVTTLRPRGQVFIGRKTITSSGTTVVGNPYASAVDFNSMIRTGAGWPANPTYYVWDPYLGGATGQGAFVTLTWNGTDFTRTSPYGAGTFDNRYIPSGAAIMVDFPAGGGTLTFRETDKSAANTTTAFRPITNQLMTVLNTVNADSSTYVSDGVLNLFGENFNNDADVDDAVKLSNFTENFGLARGDRILSVERRKLVKDVDTIFYNISRMQAKKYQFQFIMDKIGASPTTAAFLEDLYLKKKTPVNMQDTTRIGFSISTNEDAAKDRFRLVFRRSVNYNSFDAFVLKSDIAVKWKVDDEFNIKEYIVERSTDGKHFTAVGTVASAGNSTAPVSYQWLDIAPEPGEYFYRIQSLSNDGIVVYSDVVSVRIVKGSPGLYVFPNPVTNNIVQLQLNDKPAGKYTVKLLSSTGQVLLNTTIMHAGGTATRKIQPSQFLVNGVYNLEVTDPGKITTVLKVVVSR